MGLRKVGWGWGEFTGGFPPSPDIPQNVDSLLPPLQRASYILQSVCDRGDTCHVPIAPALLDTVEKFLGGRGETERQTA